MAITAVLVFAGHNRLRYFVDATVGGGETVEIPAVGGATPDLITDSLAGPLKQIARVETQGYGLIPAGGLTTLAQARALMQSDNNLTVIGPNKPTAICRFEQRAGTRGILVDAIRNGGVGPAPSILLTGLQICSGYLEIEIPGSIGP
jgi:hypothetical protein